MKTFTLLAVGLAALLFMLQNHTDVPYNFLMMKRMLPLNYIAAYGFFMGMLTAVVAIWSLSDGAGKKKKLDEK